LLDSFSLSSVDVLMLKILRINLPAWIVKTGTKSANSRYMNKSYTTQVSVLGVDSTAVNILAYEFLVVMEIMTKTTMGYHFLLGNLVYCNV